MTLEEAKKLKRVLDDPEAFARVFLTHHLTYPETPAFHRGIYKALLGSDRLLVVAPRSFAKSTLVSFFWPLFLALTKRAKRIFLISATGALASEWLRKIKGELEHNDLLRGFFGDQVSAKWTEDVIELKNGCQIVAKGAGYQIRGFRPDYVVVDDIETDESVRSEEQRRKLLEWFDSALTNTLESTSRMAVIGTILHPLSILKKLQVRDGWRTLFFQALIQGPDGSQESLWSQKWPVEALLARKAEIGSRAFASEFQNQPVGPEQAVVKEEHVLTCERSRPSEFVKTVIACDPAASKQDWADYSAVVVASLTQTGFYRVRHVRRGRWSLLELVEHLFRVSKLFPDARVVIEAQAYEKALEDVILKLGRERKTPIAVGSVKADADKIRRLERVSHLFEQRLVYFEVDGGTMDRETAVLVDELLTFPEGEHDDAVDALTYALQDLRYGSGTVFAPAKPLPLVTRPTYDPQKVKPKVFTQGGESSYARLVGISE